jgi:hypothetical protein
MNIEAAVFDTVSTVGSACGDPHDPCADGPVPHLERQLTPFEANLGASAGAAR